MLCPPQRDSIFIKNGVRIFQVFAKVFVAVLLTLWGALSFLVAWITEDRAFDSPVDLFYVRGAATVLHAVGCFAAGVWYLLYFLKVLRSSRPVGWLLAVTSGSVVVIAIANIPLWLRVRPDLELAVREWTIQYLMGAAILAVLGRWLSRRDGD